MSSLLDVLLSPWAILPDRLTQLQALYEQHAAGGRVDLEALRAASGKKMENEPQGYSVEGDGVAVVPLRGVLAKRANLFHSISGGASHELFARDVRAAAEDKRVRAILLEIESPGGTVDGTVMAAQAVQAVRGRKPIAALADSLMASAAYWVGSWADDLYAVDGVTSVGSIGVVATHIDQSRAEEARGIKVTEVVAGKYKRVHSPHQPLGEEGRAALQAHVDTIYAQFLESVAAARRVPVEQVVDMAEGRIFVGRAAVDARLVDGIATRADLITELGTRARRLASPRVPMGRTALLPERSPMSKLLTPEMAAESVETIVAALRAEHPQVVEAIASPERGAGATAERERIQAVRKQSMPGHEALIEQLAFDGTTTGPEAAVAVLNAERAAAEARQQALAADAAKAKVPAAPSATGDDTPPKARGDAGAQAEAQELSARIQAHMQAAAAQGRQITPVQALAELGA
jgi:signal peptide peptidase SppA